MKASAHHRLSLAAHVGGAAGIALVLLLAASLLQTTQAQQQFTPDQLQQLQQSQLQQSQQSGRQLPAVPTDQPIVTVQQPDAQPPPPAAQSRLELILSQRAGTRLRLFGYETLGVGRAVAIAQAGAIQDDYILGPGDEIVVSLRGQENNEVRTVVTRDGQVVLPRLGPISAGGRAFGSFRQDLQAAVSRTYVATEAFVSLGRVRQVSVLVSGEVNNPGTRTVSGLASVVDALLLSGGIRKTGSLRNVRIQRGGREIVVDLYSVLSARTSSVNLRLADGDKISVPLLGPVVAVSGLVRQPAIYELPAGRTSIAVKDLLALAGGEEVKGSYRLSTLRLDAQGRSQLMELRDESGAIGDSEILFVDISADQTVSRVTLAGPTALAGNYPIVTGTKLSDILRAPGAMGQNPYTLFGILARRDPKTLLRTLVAFTPTAVMNGREDIALQPDDIVRVLSVEEAHMVVATVHDYSLAEQAGQVALRNPISATNITAAPPAPLVPLVPLPQLAQTVPGPGGVFPSGVNMTASTSADAVLANSNIAADASATQQNTIRTLSRRDSEGRGASTDVSTPDLQQRVAPNGGYSINLEAINFDQLVQQLGVDRLVLINFASELQVDVVGAIRGPGTYIVGPTVMLQDLVAAAGGTPTWFDASGIEVITTTVDNATGRASTQRARMPATMMANYLVRPRDEFRFNEVFTDVDLGSITIQGEVRFPGNYRLIRGEHLSDLLERAGGLTNSAYPYGTVFLRKTAALSERDAYIRDAKEVEDQLVVAMTRAGTNRLDATTFAAMQGFVNDLRNQKPIGRVAIIADPSVLASRPNQDPLLESSDVIYIPSRPSTVAVLGQVMQSGSFPYAAGASVSDYIQKAGGYSNLADQSEVFVVLPDGTARKVEKSWLRIETADVLPPGSAIVVPRDVLPFDLRQTVIDISQIFGQLAIAVASLAVLSKQ